MICFLVRHLFTRIELSVKIAHFNDIDSHILGLWFATQYQ
jgi:hypothetical protein